MTDISSSDALAHRIAETERLLRDTRERQIRTDENVNLLKDGQGKMSGELASVLVAVQELRAEQRRDSASTARWVKAAVILIPIIPTILHMVGH